MSFISAFEQALADTVSERCSRCREPVTTGTSKEYHARKCYCSQCNLYYCTACAVTSGSSLCPSGHVSGQLL